MTARIGIEFAAIVWLDVNLPEIFGTGARLVVRFDNDLILVVSLLYQIDVVLRISGAQQALELGGGNAVKAGAVAIDIDVEVGRVAEKVGTRRGGETIVVVQFGGELVRRSVDFDRD